MTATTPEAVRTTAQVPAQGVSNKLETSLLNHFRKRRQSPTQNTHLMIEADRQRIAQKLRDRAADIPVEGPASSLELSPALSAQEKKQAIVAFFLPWVGIDDAVLMAAAVDGNVSGFRFLRCKNDRFLTLLVDYDTT